MYTYEFINISVFKNQSLEIIGKNKFLKTIHKIQTKKEKNVKTHVRDPSFYINTV